MAEPALQPLVAEGGHVVRDRMDPARAAALQAVLGMPGPAPADGDALIPFGHHVYFWETLPPWSLGQDGSPAPGSGFLPDLGEVRRIWTGGALFWHAPLRLGRVATRTTSVETVARKTGRLGQHGFVAVSHRVEQDGALILTERQSLDYRAGGGPAGGAAQPAALPGPTEAEVEEPVLFDAMTLFRYAALCFDPHRIHYDAAYAREVEGYAERVVANPLLAQGLVLMAGARLGPLIRFSFRAAAPLCLGEEARFCAGRCEGPRLKLWVRGPGGRLCMSAEAEATEG